MRDMEWRINQVCKTIGLKMSQAQYWTRLGVIQADVTGPTSQGKARLFSIRNLFEFSLVRELTKRGIHASDTKVVLEKIREIFPELDQGAKYELITWRTMKDPYLVHFGEGFFLASLLDMETKGVPDLWIGGESPPRKFLEEFGVRGFGGKISVVLQYYPSVLIMNLETLRSDLVNRLNAES